MERIYSIYEAKAKLSEVIRHVKKNGRVTITDRGKPVAEVIPYVHKEISLEERIKELEEKRLLSPAVGHPANIKPLFKKKGALKRFLESRD